MLIVERPTVAVLTCPGRMRQGPEGGRVEIEHFGVLESRVIRVRSAGRLTGRDGVTRTPPSERRVITFRAAKGLRMS